MSQSLQARSEFGKLHEELALVLGCLQEAASQARLLKSTVRSPIISRCWGHRVPRGEHPSQAAGSWSYKGLAITNPDLKLLREQTATLSTWEGTYPRLDAMMKRRDRGKLNHENCIPAKTNSIRMNMTSLRCCLLTEIRKSLPIDTITWGCYGLWETQLSKGQAYALTCSEIYELWVKGQGQLGLTDRSYLKTMKVLERWLSG